MRKMIIAALSVTALAISGVALADGDEADATADLSAAGGPVLYIDAETQGLWEESNDDPGLQTQAHTHTVDGEDVVIAADTLVGQLPTAPDLPSPPDLP
ncbi:MAG: hypothetical protein ACLGH3_06110 [Actinomycetota bacterium]